MTDFEKNQTFEGFVPATFKIIMASGKKDQVGWVKGEISIYESWAFDDLESMFWFTYHVSHVRTGYRIGSFNDKGQAFSFANYCAQFNAWENVTDEKPQLDPDFSKKIKLIRELIRGDTDKVAAMKAQGLI